MAMSRIPGSRALTASPSIRTVPPVTDSSPAIIRSSDDLPQPDGPTMTMNSPSATSRETPSTAGGLPS